MATGLATRSATAGESSRDLPQVASSTPPRCSSAQPQHLPPQAGIEVALGWIELLPSNAHTHPNRIVATRLIIVRPAQLRGLHRTVGLNPPGK